MDVSLTGSPARISEKFGLTGGEWSPLLVQQGEAKNFRGLWRTHEGFVLTVVAELQPELVRCQHDGGPPL